MRTRDKLVLVVVAFILLIVNILLYRTDFNGNMLSVRNTELDIVVQADRYGGYTLWTIYNSGGITRTLEFQTGEIDTVIYNLKPRDRVNVVSLYSKDEYFEIFELGADLDQVSCSNVESVVTQDNDTVYVSVKNNSEYTATIMCQVAIFRGDDIIKCLYETCEDVSPFSISEMKYTLLEEGLTVKTFSYPTIVKNFE